MPQERKKPFLFGAAREATDADAEPLLEPLRDPSVTLRPWVEAAPMGGRRVGDAACMPDARIGADESGVVRELSKLYRARWLGVYSLGGEEYMYSGEEYTAAASSRFRCTNSSQASKSKLRIVAAGRSRSHKVRSDGAQIWTSAGALLSC